MKALFTLRRTCHPIQSIDMQQSSAPPPAYEAAVRNEQYGGPGSQATGPQGGQTAHQANSANTNQKGNLQRMTTNDSISSAGDYGEDQYGKSLVEDDDRRSMDDETRDLPKGWVRCFDPKSVPPGGEVIRCLMSYEKDQSPFLRR